MSRIGLIGENSIEYIGKLLDIWNSGNCAVLIDWRIPFQTAVEMMEEAGVSSCYLENAKYEIKEPSAEINFITYEKKSNSAGLLPTEIYDKFKSNYSRNEAIVLYSSGTTGKAKGIILSHYAINTNADAIIDYMKPSDTDCIYIAKVLSHSSTLTGELLVSLKTKIKLIVAPTIVPPRFVFKNIDKFGVSIICLNPTLLQKFSEEYATGKYTIPTLKTIYVSGSILSDKVYSAAHSTFKDIAIYNVYGISEAGPRVTAQHADCCKSNSVGKPIKGVEIQIFDDEGNPLNQGERGVVHVNTPSLFDGYIVGNEKNKSLYDGWLNTGDIGFIDKNNELHIVDRLDDVIVIDSYKIYPSEVEKQVSLLFPITECAVMGIELKDYSTMIVCFYCGEPIDDRNIKTILTSVLALHEIPKVFIRKEKLIKTQNGKLDKQTIKNNFESNTLNTQIKSKGETIYE